MAYKAVTLMTRVIATTERPGVDGELYCGELEVEVRESGGASEPLADAVERELNAAGCKLEPGDRLFFPSAAGGHRTKVVR